MRKHPVSIALSNRILQKIDQEATREKTSRSDWIELHFEALFLNKQEKDQSCSPPNIERIRYNIFLKKLPILLIKLKIRKK